MKKRMIFISALAALLLAGCTAPEGAQSGSALPQSMPAAQEEETAAKPDLRLVQSIDLADSDGTVLLTARPTPLPNGDYGGTLLCVADRQTGKAQPLCGQAGCTHRTAACPAWRGPELRNAPRYVAITQDYYADLFFHDGELQAYFFPKQSGEPVKTVWKAPEEVAGLEASASGSLVDDNTIYIWITFFSRKQQVPPKTEMFVLSQEGITQDVLLEDGETICGVWGREVLIRRQKQSLLGGETEEARRASQEHQKCQLYFRHQDTGETRFLQEADGRWYMCSGKFGLYWQGKTAIHTLEYETGQEYQFEPEPGFALMPWQIEQEGKILLGCDGPHHAMADYKTGALESAPDLPEAIVAGTAEDCLLLYDPGEERWSLWPVADYLNGVEPCWFDFSACDT